MAESRWDEPHVFSFSSPVLLQMTLRVPQDCEVKVIPSPTSPDKAVRVDDPWEVVYVVNVKDVLSLARSLESVARLARDVAKQKGVKAE